MSTWQKSSCFFVMLAGFVVCAVESYVAHVNGNFPYPNGDMTTDEIERAEASINGTIRFQQRLAATGAIVGMCSAGVLWMGRRRSGIS